jgi:hypothetical protein
MEWIGWLSTLERSERLLIHGSILCFCLLAPMALTRGGRRALLWLWAGILVPFVFIGWHHWRSQFGTESPGLPLFDIAFYALPIGGATACAAAALLWATGRGDSRAMQYTATLVAAYLPLPVVFAVSMCISFVIYGLTGGFI